MSAAVMFPSEQQEKEEHLMLLMPIRINEESYDGESSSEENE
jgi:hypothetical protein